MNNKSLLLTVLLLFYASVASLACLDTFSYNKPLVITAGGDTIGSRAYPLHSSLYVPHAYSFPIVRATVRLNNLYAENAVIMNIILTTPDGNEITLLWDGYTASHVTVSFSSNSTVWVPTSVSSPPRDNYILPAGDYINSATTSSQFNMSDLVGENAYGVWSMRVSGGTDFNGFSFDSWDLILHTSCPNPQLSPPPIKTCWKLIDTDIGAQSVTNGEILNIPLPFNSAPLAALADDPDGPLYIMKLEFIFKYLYADSLNNDEIFINLSDNSKGIHLISEAPGFTTSFNKSTLIFSDYGNPSRLTTSTISTQTVFSPEVTYDTLVGHIRESRNIAWMYGTDILEGFNITIVSGTGELSFRDISINVTVECGTYEAPVLACEEDPVDVEVSACSAVFSSIEDVYTLTPAEIEEETDIITSLDVVDSVLSLSLGTTNLDIMAKNYWGTAGPCSVSIVVDTPLSADPCGSHGECGPTTCECDEGYGGDYCCPSTSLNGTIEDETCGSPAHGECIFGGTCSCEDGYDGEFCCAQDTGQATPCGDNGECQASNSTCLCEDGYEGNACQTDERCPTSDINVGTCSDDGTCISFDLLIDVLPELGYIDDGSVTMSVGGTYKDDEGQTLMIQAILFEFLDDDNVANYLSTINSFYVICTNSRLTCLRDMATDMFESDLIYDTFTLANYPIGSTPDFDDGIDLLVGRGIRSFLGISSASGTYASLKTTLHDQCYDGPCNGVTDRDTCLFECLRTVVITAAPYSSNAATVIYQDDPAVGELVNNTLITDEGIGHFIVRMVDGFLHINGSNQTYVDYYLSLDATDLTRVERMDMITREFSKSLIFNQTLTKAASNYTKYVETSLNRLFPSRVLDEFNWPTSVLTYFGVQFSKKTGDLLTIRSEAIMYLMSTEWIWYNNENKELQTITEFTTFPKYVCDCSDASTGTSATGLTLALEGITCSIECSLNPDTDIPCSGFNQGLTQGLCQPVSSVNNEGVCKCGWGWGGEACQFSTLPYCYDDVGTNVTAECSGWSHGACVINDTDIGTFYCDCNDGWAGDYCDTEDCPTSGDDDLMCGGLGECAMHIDDGDDHPICHCDVEDWLLTSTNSSYLPLLPTGEACEFNGIVECGQFIETDGDTGQGYWTECNWQGQCMVPIGGDDTPVCVCDEGFFGDKCQYIGGDDGFCPALGHSIYNETTGSCECNLMWSTAEDCNDNSCLCQTSLCGHGTPDITGTVCECDARWEKAVNETTCTVPICPMVMKQVHGEKVCDENDPICQEGDDSLEDQCCIQTCYSCGYNETTEKFYCECDPAPIYDEEDGVCFTKCHGQPYINDTETFEITCDCSALLEDTENNEAWIWDSDCEVLACLNGGYANEDHSECICPATNSGIRCQNALCGERGESNTITGVCDCYPPFYREIKPNRLTGMLELLDDIMKSTIVTEAIESFVDDPDEVVNLEGTVYKLEDFVTVAKSLVQSFGVAEDGPDPVTELLADINLTPSIEDFDLGSLVEAISTVCKPNITGNFGRCVRLLGYSVGTSYLLGHCPGIECEKVIFGLAAQSTCPLTGGDTIGLAACLLDGSDNFYSELLTPSTRYIDKAKVKVLAYGEEYEDEGQVVMINDFILNFAGNASDLLSIIYEECPYAEDNIQRTLCMQKRMFAMWSNEVFVELFDDRFKDDPDVTVTVAGEVFTDEGTVNLMRTAVAFFPFPNPLEEVIDIFAPKFFSPLCDEYLLNREECRRRVIVSASTCNTRLECNPDYADTNDVCKTCISNIYSQWARCIPYWLYDASVGLFNHLSADKWEPIIACFINYLENNTPGLTSTPFLSVNIDSPSTSVTIQGTSFSDEGQIAFIRAFISAFNLGSVNDVDLINEFYRTIATQATSLERGVLCSGSNANGGQVALASSGPTKYIPVCPSNQLLVNTTWLGCEFLDCNTPDGILLCSQCANGGSAYVESNEIKCDCTGTGFNGCCCAGLQCLNGGVLISNGTECDCPPVWGGVNCGTTLCQHGGTASDEGDGCYCNTPFTGTLCEENDCENGGIPNELTHRCTCPSNWTGVWCTIAICQNGGVPLVDGTCQCPEGYKGTRCEIQDDDTLLPINPTVVAGVAAVVGVMIVTVISIGPAQVVAHLSIASGME